MPIPNQTFETGYEDIQNVESDISTLFQTYIAPIEAIRSFARPTASSNSVITSAYQNLQINNNTPLESRAHAFYRMLGFPVAISDGNFYNAGFPYFTGKLDSKININTKFYSDPLQTLINRREDLPIELKSIFQRQDLNSSVYTLILRHVKPFSVIKTGAQPFDVDQQKYSVKDREVEVTVFASYNSQISDQIMGTADILGKTAIGPDFNGGQHILKPFLVDPRIVNTVMSDKNIIAIPFLKSKSDLQLEPGIYAQRPGIELIIRQRLQDEVKDSNFLANVQKILSGDNAPGITTSDLDFETIQSAVAALADDNKISGDDVSNILQGFTSIQAVTVQSLVKLIKSCVFQLSQSIKVIDHAKMTMNWVPVPSINGPETGANGATLSRIGTNNASSELDNQIAELRIKKLNADRAVSQGNELGDFASPFNANSGGENTKLYEDQLQELVQKRDKLANDAFQAMANIEIITGEVSGLGLVDILAIYMALWSIDIGSLLAFLDLDSFQRLVSNNPDLASTANQNYGKSIITALSDLEKKVINILSFADKLLAQQLISPLQEEGGFI